MKFIVTKMVSQTYDDASKGIIRVPRMIIDGQKLNKAEKFFRRELVTIVNHENGKRVVRHVVGDNQQYKLVGDSAAIDYEARDTLGIRRLDGPVNVEIVRSTLLDRLAYFWNSEDPAMRIANRITVIALVISLKDFIDLVSAVADLFR